MTNKIDQKLRTKLGSIGFPEEVLLWVIAPTSEPRVTDSLRALGCSSHIFRTTKHFETEVMSSVLPSFVASLFNEGRFLKRMRLHLEREQLVVAVHAPNVQRARDICSHLPSDLVDEPVYFDRYTVTQL